MLRQRFNQFHHQRQVNHGRFIDHQQIKMEWITCMMTKLSAARNRAKQTMNGAGSARDRRGDLRLYRQLTHRFTHRFG
ncbi:Uncharacterised protein [Vibrio cholerae]|uniref:Uncharacterized protein n=1 Tax=Vibrio cholerae TaxID=666 RepID=A0A655W6R3_VIBCL|nr:Uncharacterised protein [Vibrio cholerae]